VPGALDHDQIIDQALEVGRGEVRGACAPAHGDEKLCGLQVSAFQYLTILAACGRPLTCHSGARSAGIFGRLLAFDDIAGTISAGGRRRKRPHHDLRSSDR
jgi:hypothetical protein